MTKCHLKTIIYPEITSRATLYSRQFSYQETLSIARKINLSVRARDENEFVEKKKKKKNINKPPLWLPILLHK